MPHIRARSILSHFQKLASFWPIVGILGLRQVGKSTFLRELAGFQNILSLDDEDIREEAQGSAKVFLAKLPHPCVIDEIQKVPKLFDALKSAVDKKKRPGQWIVTGSVLFQSLSAVRESLTGRIGLVQMHPMTLAEMEQLKFNPIQTPFLNINKPRVDIAKFSSHLALGGIPVPSFVRDQSNRELFFKSWLSTLLIRDAALVYGPSYDYEVCNRVLKTMGQVLSQGEHPQLTDFKIEARKLKKYLKTLETLFLIRRFSVHECGVGKDYWLPTDSGFAHHIMGYPAGLGVNLTLARVLILNEIIANLEYQGKSASLTYYKSQHGSVVDLVWENVPIKIISENIASSKLGWIEKPLLGAMKKLNAKRGIIVTPMDQVSIEKDGISVVPWSYWS